ncbi:uncharacterized protein LOC144115994 isoform X2 [Amblyomma americanum]
MRTARQKAWLLLIAAFMAGEAEELRLLFVNKTRREVDVICLNYEGRGVKCRSPSPNQAMHVDICEPPVDLSRLVTAW